MPIQQMLLGLGAKDYEIERSLRFNSADEPRLNITPSSDGNRKTWTFSFWFKRGSIDRRMVYGAYTSGADTAVIEIGSDHKLAFYDYNSGYRLQLITNQLFKDPSAWYHVVIALDTTQSTSSNRAKIYVNGSQITSFSTETYPSQNLDGKINTGSLLHAIGTEGTNQRLWFDGYMAEVHFIDGTALDASSFGKTKSSTNQWIPKKYSGSHGTNGYYLNYSDNSSTSNLGTDASSNSNNFTPVNFSVTAGKDDDSMFDSPTNNFPTLSPLDRSLVGTMSNGNLRVSYNYKPASKSWRSTMALPSSGKFYWEWENEEPSTNGGRWQTGLVRYTDEAGVVDFQGYNDVNYVSISFGGSTWNGTTQLNPPGSGWPQDGSVSFYSGERAAIAIDCSNGKWWLGVVQTNGSTTWYANDGGTDGDPAGGTNETATLPSFTTATEWMPHIVWHDGGAASSTTFTSNINFGNHSFLGTVPTGFEKLCSANLPDQTILLPNKHFDTLLWTGNDSDNRDITGLNFAPDLVWLKRRDGTMSHNLGDTVRGANKIIFSDQNAVENTETDRIKAYNSDGFRLGTDSAVNYNGYTYVGWNWNAGGSTATNNDGSVTSQVRANTTAGFSIVSYTGTGSGGATVGHGLGVAPDVVIVKNRDYADVWLVGHHKLGFTKELYLNLTNAAATSDNGWWNTAPTSSVITLGDGNATNKSSDEHIAYCFREVAGFSKFGSYVGNGNNDGSFIYTGFKVKWLLIKRTSSEHWILADTARNSVSGRESPADSYLLASSSNAESTGIVYDMLSNGVKFRSNSQNENGSTYVYMAFAESPFKYSRAR